MKLAKPAPDIFPAASKGSNRPQNSKEREFATECPPPILGYENRQKFFHFLTGMGLVHF